MQAGQVLGAAKADSSKFAKHNINLIETHMDTTFHPFERRLLWFLPSLNSPNWWNRDVWQCVVRWVFTMLTCKTTHPPTADVKMLVFNFSHKDYVFVFAKVAINIELK